MARATFETEVSAHRMIMLSTLRRFKLCDAGGRCVPVSDFAIDLLSDHHPAVTHLRYRDHQDHHSLLGVERALPWSAVQAIDWEARRFQVEDLGAGDEASEEHAPAAEENVLLRRDILDALLLDLQNRRAARANDLALTIEDGGRLLRLKAADMSLLAMLRRVSNGRFGGRVVSAKLFDWKYIEFLRGDPQAVTAGAAYHRRIVRLPAGEIARLVDALPYLHAAELLTLLPNKLAADTLESMSAQRQLQVFEELSQDQQVALLALMAPDLATDLLGRVHTENARVLLNALPRAQAERIVDLLRYPEDTVGGIMTNDVLSVVGNLTVGDARESLRKRLADPDFIYFIYVIESEESRKLRGVLPLRALLIGDDDARVEDIMNPYLVTLHALEEARAAAYRVLNSQLVALPVVGKEGRLLGAVTIDEAVALVAPASWGAQEMRVFS